MAVLKLKRTFGNRINTGFIATLFITNPEIYVIAL